MVKKISWNKLFLLSLLKPKLFLKFLKLPRNYKTLDEWLEVDLQKTDIMAKIVCCKNPESLKQQQRENMEYRKEFTDSFEAWIKVHSKQEVHSEKINDIALEYAVKRNCHRDYKNGGVVCYCK
jgi:hypothetical protein